MSGFAPDESYLFNRGQARAPFRVVVRKLFTFIPFILVAAGLPCSLAAADFQAGLEAYKRGDFAVAMQEWMPYAQRGDGNAEYNIGLLYAQGRGVQKDTATAVEWYKKAAAHGVAAAAYNLGIIY